MIFTYLFSLLLIEKSMSWGICSSGSYPYKWSDCQLVESDCPSTYRKDLEGTDCCWVLDNKCEGTGNGDLSCKNSYCGGCYAIGYTNSGVIGGINVENCMNYEKDEYSISSHGQSSVCPYGWPIYINSCKMDKSSCLNNEWRTDLQNEDCCSIVDNKCEGTPNNGAFNCKNSYCGGCWAVYTNNNNQVYGSIDASRCMVSGMSQ